MSCEFFGKDKFYNCMVKNGKRKYEESENLVDLTENKNKRRIISTSDLALQVLRVISRLKVETKKEIVIDEIDESQDSIQDNKYDELIKEISESKDREKLNDGNEYDRRIQDINADKLSGKRNIERLQERRKERFVMLNRLKEENILNENRRRDNERYDELMNLIYKAEVLDGDYYDDEIKKLDENYLIDGRTIPRICVFLDLTRDIREKTNIGDDIERLRDGRYLSVEIDNSILL